MRILKLTFSAVMAMGLAVSCRDIPMVFDQENTAASFPVPAMPSVEDLEITEGLPDPLAFENGGKVKRYSQWERRRDDPSCSTDQSWHICPLDR